MIIKNSDFLFCHPEACRLGGIRLNISKKESQQERKSFNVESFLYLDSCASDSGVSAGRGPQPTSHGCNPAVGGRAMRLLSSTAEPAEEMLVHSSSRKHQAVRDRRVLCAVFKETDVLQVKGS